MQDPEIWPLITPIGRDRCILLLNAVLGHWTSTLRLNQLALIVHQLSGKAMVQSTFQPCKDTFLYAVSLVWCVDSIVTLADALAEAAFNLATRSTGRAKAAQAPMAGMDLAQDDYQKEAIDEVVALPYDTPTMDLPPWFEEAWNR